MSNSNYSLHRASDTLGGVIGPNCMVHVPAPYRRLCVARLGFRKRERRETSQKWRRVRRLSKACEPKWVRNTSAVWMINAPIAPYPGVLVCGVLSATAASRLFMCWCFLTRLAYLASLLPGYLLTMDMLGSLQLVSPCLSGQRSCDLFVPSEMLTLAPAFVVKRMKYQRILNFFSA
jgi:hypothetical protein